MAGLYSVRGDEPIFVVEKLSGVLILKLIADPATSNYHSKQFEYNRMMKAVSEPEVQQLLFDFGDCVNVDSVTVGILTSLAVHLNEFGGRTAMCNCSQDLGRLMDRLIKLEPAGKQTTWPHYSSRRQAIETLCSESN
ncbi:MAG: STAS domain-containing protein [Rhodopirellula sp.]|nr:STAS domain-containing protein [Rhodopirellula sp.]